MMTLPVVLSYLLGSISSAILVCWLFRLPDPRESGSNNPGATNVLRIGGKLPALLTLIGDMLKGVIAIVVAKWLGFSSVILCFVMVSVFLGHIYPVFFKFKGGKGVATALGAFFALSWQFAAALIATWFVAFGLSRISSVGALVMTISAPIYSWFLLEPTYMYAITPMSLILLLKHKDNIKRLCQGTEKKISKAKN